MKKRIKKSNLYSKLKYLYKKYFLSDVAYIKKKYRRVFNTKINLKNPKTFNEKLQWLKLNDRNPIYTNMVDKYEVRKYVSEIIGEKYLIPLLGVWENFDEIDILNLPNQFVLKCTHDSGGVVVCRNKNTFNFKLAKNKLERSLKKNYYYDHREWPYKNVKPRIICEKYMIDEGKEDLIDYKFMCFNGKVKCSFLCSNRNSKSGLNIDIYDREWNLMPVSRFNKKNGVKVDKPVNYDKMIELAEKLSKDIPFIRVDFYEVNKKVYFGELTFYPASGFEKFEPEEYDYILGGWLNLPEM